MRRQDWLWTIAFALGLAVLVVYLLQRFPGAIDDGDQPRLVFLIILLVAVGGSLVLHIRSRPGTALRHAAIWVALGLVLVIGFSYRDVVTDLRARLTGELLPQAGRTLDDGTVMFRADADGHFHVEALVDGTPVVFMVDTGASDVALTPADARRLGLDPETLDYTRAYSTANGVVYGAPVRIGEMSVGPIRLTNVAASVNQAPMPRSLLGMSFLGRLSGYEVRGDQLTLRR